MSNQPLNIEWQRLLIEKETCPRCGSTEQELDKAIKELGRRGIKVDLSLMQLKRSVKNGILDRLV